MKRWNVGELIGRIQVALVIATLSLALAGCEEEGPAERAGKRLDDAMDELRDSTEDAREEAQQALDEARRKFNEAMETAREKLDEER